MQSDFRIAKEFAAEYQAPLKCYSETGIRSLAKKLRNHRVIV